MWRALLTSQSSLAVAWTAATLGMQHVQVHLTSAGQPSQWFLLTLEGTVGFLLRCADCHQSPPPALLPAVSAPLGTSTVFRVPLSNPYPESLLLVAHTTSPALLVDGPEVRAALYTANSIAGGA